MEHNIGLVDSLTLRMPPLNLISAPDWYTLLFKYPLLADVSKVKTTSAIRSYYGSRYGTTHS